METWNDISKEVLKNLNGALEYRQLCLDLLPNIESEVRLPEDDEVIESEQIVPELDPSQTTLSFPGYFDAFGKTWIYFNTIEPATDEIIVAIDQVTGEHRVVVRSKFNEYQTEHGTLINFKPYAWRPATTQEQTQYVATSKTIGKALENITDILA